MKELERTLKAIASRRRLAIIKFLKGRREAPVWMIAKQIGLSYKTTSKHLAVLSAADLVESEQRGVEMFYSLVNPHPHAIKHIITIL